jgi:hypothetical protein
LTRSRYADGMKVLGVVGGAAVLFVLGYWLIF